MSNHFQGWKPCDPSTLPDNREGPFLVTNHPEATNAHGMPSHVWLVNMLHADGPDVVAFAGDSDRKVLGVRLYRPVFPRLEMGAVNDAVPADVAGLVIAARVVAFEDQSPEALKRLDDASEAFAARVPWADEPAVEEYGEEACAGHPAA